MQISHHVANTSTTIGRARLSLATCLPSSVVTANLGAAVPFNEANATNFSVCCTSFEWMTNQNTPAQHVARTIKNAVPATKSLYFTCSSFEPVSVLFGWIPYGILV